MAKKNLANDVSTEVLRFMRDTGLGVEHFDRVKEFTMKIIDIHGQLTLSVIKSNYELEKSKEGEN